MEERQLVLEQHQKTLGEGGQEGVKDLQDGSQNLNAGDGMGDAGDTTWDATAVEVKTTLSAAKASGGAKARKRAIVDVRKALRGEQVVSEGNAGCEKKEDTGKKGISRMSAAAGTKKVEVGKTAVAGTGKVAGAGKRGWKGNEVSAVKNSDASVGRVGLQVGVREEGNLKSDMVQEENSGDHLALLKQEVFVCKECGKKFKYHVKLKCHMNYHKRRNAFKCNWPDCDKTFHGKFQLSAHRRVHTGEKPYSCAEPDCNKAFKNVGNLNRHKVCHSTAKLSDHIDRKLFKCPLPDCTQEFTQKSYIKRHLRIHSGEKPFECPQHGCSSRFTEKGSLKIHMVAHSGEKPFKCQKQGCQKAFSLKGNLYRHENNHHKMGLTCKEEGQVEVAEEDIPAGGNRPLAI